MPFQPLLAPPPLCSTQDSDLGSVVRYLLRPVHIWIELLGYTALRWDASLASPPLEVKMSSPLEVQGSPPLEVWLLPHLVPAPGCWEFRQYVLWLLFLLALASSIVVRELISNHQLPSQFDLLTLILAVWCVDVERKRYRKCIQHPFFCKNYVATVMFDRSP